MNYDMSGLKGGVEFYTFRPWWHWFAMPLVGWLNPRERAAAVCSCGFRQGGYKEPQQAGRAWNRHMLSEHS